MAGVAPSSRSEQPKTVAVSMAGYVTVSSAPSTSAIFENGFDHPPVSYAVPLSTSAERASTIKKSVKTEVSLFGLCQHDTASKVNINTNPLLLA